MTPEKAAPDFARARVALTNLERASDDWLLVRDTLSLAESEVSRLSTQVQQAEEQLRLTREAAALKRATILRDTGGLIGEWVAVPKEDFDALRVALSVPQRQESANG